MYLQVPVCYQVENILANCLYSIHILFYFKIYKPFFKWHNLITYAGDGYCRFRVTLVISLTMPNKKYFLIFYSWRFLQAITLNILVRNLDPKCSNLLQLEKCSTIYSKPDLLLCFDCDARPLRCVFLQLSFIPSPHGIIEDCPCWTTTGLWAPHAQYLTKIFKCYGR